jgi:hypothetical protein
MTGKRIATASNLNAISLEFSILTSVRLTLSMRCYPRYSKLGFLLSALSYS